MVCFSLCEHSVTPAFIQTLQEKTLLNPVYLGKDDVIHVIKYKMYLAFPVCFAYCKLDGGNGLVTRFHTIGILHSSGSKCNIVSAPEARLSISLISFHQGQNQRNCNFRIPWRRMKCSRTAHAWKGRTPLASYPGRGLGTRLGHLVPAVMSHESWNN